MKTFIRDATVQIAIKFYDADGVVTNPTAATVTMSYNHHGRRTHETYDLVQVDDLWTYSWDSRVADEGAVFGHVQTGDDVPVSAGDFEFRLLANRANECAARDAGY